jgi:ferric enterobactin receptor
MKLAAMVKYLFVKCKNNAFLIVFILLPFFCSQLNAQKYKLSFTDTPISEALLKVAEQLNIKVAFDAHKLSLIRVTTEVAGNTPEELISKLLSNTNFEFQYKHQRFLVYEKADKPDALPQEVEITGSITDRDMGEQLPYASVRVYDQNLQISASSTGSFSVKNINTSPVHLGISFIGYYALDTFVNCSGSQWNASFKLSRKPQIIDTVTVKGIKVDMVDLRNDVDFATTINAGKLIDLPALAETDVFRALQLLPGICYSSNSSELNIRGGSSDQNLILFDGQTLYNLSHYYGVISSLNPNVIKDIQVYKGGYDSRFGERVSGIVDITGKSGNRIKPTIYGDLNLISGNIATEIPISEKLTAVAAFRRSYSDIYATKFANNLFTTGQDRFKPDSGGLISESQPTFYFFDFNTKFTYRFSNTNVLSLSFYGGKDFLDNSYAGSTQGLNVSNSDWNKWSNYGLSARWQKQWNSTFYSSFMIGASGYTNKYSNTTGIDKPAPQDTTHNQFLPNTSNAFNSYEENRLNDISATLQNTLQFTNSHQVDFGFLARRNSIYFYKDADKMYIYDNIDQEALITSAYVSDRLTLFNNLTLKPGFRVNFYTGNNKTYIEPRFSANYRFSGQFSLRLATGRYCQFINQVLAQQNTGYNKSFWILTDDSLHPAVTATHYIFGASAESGKFLFDAEVYYKNYKGLQEYIYVSQYLKNSSFHDYFPPNTGQSENPPEPQKEPRYYIVGKGKAYGIDMFLRYKTKGFTSWLSYSISKSTRQFAMLNNNSEMPSPIDQTHQLSWTNMFSAGKWNFGAITMFATGRPYIDYSLNNQNLPTIRNYKRLPDFTRIDLSANYNFTIRNARFKAGITIINVLNTQNYYDVNTRKFDFDNTSFSDTNLIQSQTLSLNLFLHFVL